MSTVWQFTVKLSMKSSRNKEEIQLILPLLYPKKTGFVITHRKNLHMNLPQDTISISMKAKAAEKAEDWNRREEGLGQSMLIAPVPLQPGS